MMSTTVTKVGMREFRAHLPHYLLTSSTPVAITKHGETVGFYIPARHSTQTQEREALRQAASQLDQLLATHGLTEEELLAEFRVLREERKD